MRIHSRVRDTGLLLGLALCVFGTSASAQEPVAWWRFEERTDATVLDEAAEVADELRGNWWKYVDGTRGTGLRFDGFSTVVTRGAARSPLLTGAFTIDAWIAIGAYPWSWCPIVDRQVDETRGYTFGIGPEGRLGLRLFVDGMWRIGRGDRVLERNRWYHVAGVFDPARGIALFVDGRLAGELTVTGSLVPADDADLLIGRNRTRLTPSNAVRDYATFPSWYSLDGILDEVRIHDRALSVEEIRITSDLRPLTPPDLPSRRFPRGPEATGRFGASYAKLSYYDAWDALWRVGDHPDIAVEFDTSPVRVMFWRGTRFSPCWVTENGKWMADQSLETAMNWGRGDGPTAGCCEHMSDTHCRSSHVRIVENHDARIVVHWRYALMDVLFRQPHTDPETGWADWGDEYYAIYPDGVAARSVIYHTIPGAAEWFGWQETIFLNEPGTRPEDNCELEAVTLANLAGESRTYSWEHGYPKFDLDEAVIQVVNLKSKWRPFMILPRGSRPTVFGGDVRPEYSHFPWWNHWPVAQAISDGRNAIAPDRASHSSLLWGVQTKDVSLYGMTSRPAAELTTLAKSWIDPPPASITGGAFSGGAYDDKQRAYELACEEPGATLELRFDATEGSPLLNPCLVVEGWGEDGAELTVGGKTVPRGPAFRVGHRHRLEGSDLVVWIEMEETTSVELSLAPVPR